VEERFFQGRVENLVESRALALEGNQRFTRATMTDASFGTQGLDGSH
jgi:hypothetical protein